MESGRFEDGALVPVPNVITAKLVIHSGMTALNFRRGYCPGGLA